MRNRRYDAHIYLRERFYALRRPINQISQSSGEIYPEFFAIATYSLCGLGINSDNISLLILFLINLKYTEGD